MQGRYRKKANNKSRFYLLLSVLFVVIMFKWGIPLFMDLMAGNGAERKAESEDIIPPQEPLISALPEATNSAIAIIEGYTEKQSFVELLLNDQTNKISEADENGFFSFNATLIKGLNRVQVRAKDKTGNESMSEVVLVVFDDKPMELVIVSPKDGNEYFGKLSQVIDIKGSVNKDDTQVLINNSFVSVGADGSFSHRFMLSGGENNLTINATDPAGNTASTSLRIIYTP